MKLVARIAIIAGLLWSALWLAGSVATERLVAAWLDQREESGWIVRHDELSTTGFPVRLSAEATGLTLADPFTGWAIEAPSFRLDQRPWQPQAITATWPATHRLLTPYERLTIEAETLAALLHVQLRRDLALVRSETQLQSVRIESDLGWTSAIDSAVLSFARQGGTGNRYDLGFDAQGFAPAGELLTLIDPAGLLPEAIERFHVTAEVVFDRPWDITALEQSRPQITTLDIADLRAEWGSLALRASGSLEVDEEGIPTGSLALRAQNWRTMLELSANSGAMPGALRRTLESGLAVLAGLSGRSEDLDATLRFEDGQVSLGPIPLGPAPRIVLR